MRVIAEDGEQLGILSRNEALQKAEELNQDLVLISPKAKTPVAKIMDYGKYRFQQQKKKKKKTKRNKRFSVLKKLD